MLQHSKCLASLPELVSELGVPGTRIETKTVGVPRLAEYWDSPALRAIRDSPGGGTWPDSGPARVPGLTAPLVFATALRDSGGDALLGSC
jgi:hypothetical protein